MTAATWNSLEVAKLAVSILTPVAVLFLGLVTTRLARTAQDAQWTNQKLLERRLTAYDSLAPRLTDIRETVTDRAPADLAADEPGYRIELEELTSAFRKHRHLFGQGVGRTFDMYRRSVELYLDSLNTPLEAEEQALRDDIVIEDQRLLDGMHDEIGWPKRPRHVWSWGTSSSGDF